MRIRAYLFAPLLALAAGPALAATATFVNTDGEEIGTAELTQTPNGVLINVDVDGLSAGEHGFHIHETGACDPSDGFESAGGHYAGGMEHGYLVEGGPHPGDMPNQFVGEDGKLRAHAFNEHVSLEDDGDNPLFDDDGSALMVHSGADDYESQPSGDAGDRIACAVIEQ